MAGNGGERPMEDSSSPIDGYISGFPTAIQAILREVRRVIREAAPAAEEAIKYRIPTFVLGGNLVHFAAFERHIGFYPTPSAIERFKEELSAFPSAKGSVQFPLSGPIPYDLIRQIVLFRVAENSAGRKRNSASASPRTKTGRRNANRK
jgi:uncharacterized protein YdhG (YjbR/CyaY superfamily)